MCLKIVLQTTQKLILNGASKNYYSHYYGYFM